MPSNVDALVAGFTEDCVVRFGVILEFRGRDALRKFFEARRAKQKGYRLNKQFRTHRGRRHAHAAVLNVMSETQHATASKDPDGKSASDCSKSFWAVWLPIFMTASALLGSAVTWRYSQHSAHIQAIEEKIAAARAENESLLREFLVPIQTKLKLNLSTFKQLESEYNIPGSGLLESYVIHTRENGDPKKKTLQFGLIADLV